ncbi:MAG: hypothetical protein H0W53_09495, partial [Acidobacteria bacterium]|nr:hypothetical protein [Acidobacteriota bacterium]
MRLFCSAGQPSVRILHTFVVAHDVDQVRIKEIALRIPHSLGDGVRRFGTDSGPVVETQRPDARLAHRDPSHWTISAGTEAVATGAHSPGWGAALSPDRRRGLLVAVRNFWEEAPKALTMGGREARVSLWHGDNDERLSFRRYSPVLQREEYEGIYSDGLGVAKTTEIHLSFWSGEDGGDSVAAAADALLKPLHVRVPPAWYDRCEVAGGGLAPADAASHPREEQMMAELLAWMERHVG